MTTTATDEAWAAIVAELTRRRFLGGAVSAGVTLGLIGCGDESEPAAAQTTRVVRDDRGRVRIPVAARRIVCVEPYLPSSLVELRAPLIGRPAESNPRARGVAPGDVARFNAIEAVTDESSEVALERVAALRPDLIIAPEGLHAPLGQLGDLAPMLVYAWANKQPDGELFPTVVRVADALGRTRQLDALRTRFARRAEEIAAAHAATLAGERLALFAGGDNGIIWLYRPEVPGAAVLARAGARFIDGMQPGDPDQGYIELSQERADVLDDATTLIVGGDGQGNVDATTTALLKLPTMRRLPAVRAGRVFAIDGLNLTSYGGAVASLDGFDGILRRL